MAEKSLKGKKIAVIIAFREFRDIEYFIPRNILAGAGAQIVTCSSQKGIAVGADGGEAQVNLIVQEIKVEDYDALVFIGGTGMVKNLDNPDFQRIAREAVEKGKILGAICIAPALLAKAGVLAGKNATVWSNPLDKSAVKILKEEGAKYVAEDIVIDGRIITASGPPVARQFGESIVNLLTKES